MNPTDRESPSEPASADPATPSAGFLRVLAAVFSSFLGIRRKASGERDMVTIKPVHVIVAGLLGAAIFIAILVTLVTMITRKA
jgi:Protein of unknown function (DUF2970)